ncbi:MAG TPA: hypothetical protein ENI20_04470 [Bacteroides sp.]|nr:hypothetical protein [Bacteroides sp.]
MKTKTHISIILTISLAITLIGCESSSWNCLRGNGIIDKETRDLNEYNGVVTEGEFEVFYVPDSSYFVDIETDQNLMPYIQTRISGSTLIVNNGTRKCLRSEYPIRIYVHAPEINLMILVGSGDVNLWGTTTKADYTITDLRPLSLVVVQFTIEADPQSAHIFQAQVQ